MCWDRCWCRSNLISDPSCELLGPGAGASTSKGGDSTPMRGAASIWLGVGCGLKKVQKGSIGFRVLFWYSSSSIGYRVLPMNGIWFQNLESSEDSGFWVMVFFGEKRINFCCAMLFLFVGEILLSHGSRIKTTLNMCWHRCWCPNDFILDPSCELLPWARCWSSNIKGWRCHSKRCCFHLTWCWMWAQYGSIWFHWV